MPDQDQEWIDNTVFFFHPRFGGDRNALPTAEELKAQRELDESPYDAAANILAARRMRLKNRRP